MGEQAVPYHLFNLPHGFKMNSSWCIHLCKDGGARWMERGRMRGEIIDGKINWVSAICFPANKATLHIVATGENRLKSEDARGGSQLKSPKMTFHLIITTDQRKGVVISSLLLPLCTRGLSNKDVFCDSDMASLSKPPYDKISTIPPEQRLSY